MASSLFGKMQNNNTSKANSLLGQVNQLKGLLGASGNPNEVVNRLLNKNPQFLNFYNANKDKTIEQVCTENGIDYSAFMSALGRRT